MPAAPPDSGAELEREIFRREGAEVFPSRVSWGVWGDGTYSRESVIVARLACVITVDTFYLPQVSLISSTD
jgi:hypothetical protein